MAENTPSNGKDATKIEEPNSNNFGDASSNTREPEIDVENEDPGKENISPTNTIPQQATVLGEGRLQVGGTAQEDDGFGEMTRDFTRLELEQQHDVGSSIKDTGSLLGAASQAEEDDDTTDDEHIEENVEDDDGDDTGDADDEYDGDECADENGDDETFGLDSVAIGTSRIIADGPPQHSSDDSKVTAVVPELLKIAQFLSITGINDEAVAKFCLRTNGDDVDEAVGYYTENPDEAKKLAVEELAAQQEIDRQEELARQKEQAQKDELDQEEEAVQQPQPSVDSDDSPRIEVPNEIDEPTDRASELPESRTVTPSSPHPEIVSLPAGSPPGLESQARAHTPDNREDTGDLYDASPPRPQRQRTASTSGTSPQTAEQPELTDQAELFRSPSPVNHPDVTLRPYSPPQPPTCSTSTSEPPSRTTTPTPGGTEARLPPSSPPRPHTPSPTPTDPTSEAPTPPSTTPKAPTPTSDSQSSTPTPITAPQPAVKSSWGPKRGKFGVNDPKCPMCVKRNITKTCAGPAPCNQCKKKGYTAGKCQGLGDENDGGGEESEKEGSEKEEREKIGGNTVVFRGTDRKKGADEDKPEGSETKTENLNGQVGGRGGSEQKGKGEDNGSSKEEEESQETSQSGPTTPNPQQPEAQTSTSPAGSEHDASDPLGPSSDPAANDTGGNDTGEADPEDEREHGHLVGEGEWNVRYSETAHAAEGNTPLPTTGTSRSDNDTSLHDDSGWRGIPALVETSEPFDSGPNFRSQIPAGLDVGDYVKTDEEERRAMEGLTTLRQIRIDRSRGQLLRGG